ncbi:MAG: heat-inducible transcription repressor HrcA [Ignavibacteria bacterium]|nr:heat-inducible transcription repressor HrcA [Ignavibacteria bacterium]
MYEQLSHREKEILKYIVENFIRYAIPVGSREISKKTDLNVSSATIRNVMSDLEDMELLKTPHTSAGRIPTDKGLRIYVDNLMGKKKLNSNEIEFIKNQFEDIKFSKPEEEDLYKETSKILGKISKQLSIVTQPFLDSGIFERMEMIQISSIRILVVINIKAGFVRTILMEIDSEISRNKIEKITGVLNEKLSGLSLKEIRDTFAERIGGLRNDEPELYQIFINSIDKMFSDEEKGDNIYIAGTGEVLSQPEFDDPKNLKSIIELAENKNLVIHIFQNIHPFEGEVNIKIGNENEDKKLKDYSIICTTYNIGDIKGNLGIIGPRRINYSKMVSLLEYTSKLFSEIYK